MNKIEKALFSGMDSLSTEKGMDNQRSSTAAWMEEQCVKDA